ncbi:MAG: VIT1/CCC1 transporter family protein [Patescibacteria group bacterium]
MVGGFFSRAGVYIREVVFGLEDSLVSTLGVVTGVAVITQDSAMVLVTGCVLIVVEAVSMSAGSYLSSKSAMEVFENRKKQDGSRILQSRFSDDQSVEDLLMAKKFNDSQIKKILSVLSHERSLWIKEVQRCEYRFAPAVSGHPIMAGIVMGGFYLFGGLFPLLPYAFLPAVNSLALSVGLTVFALFGLGFAKAKYVGTNPLKSGFEMAFISVSAAVIGYVIGRLASLVIGIDVY